MTDHTGHADEQLAMAVKQASLAANSDLADDHARRLIEHATSNLQIAARRIHRERIERNGDDAKLIEYEQWVANGSPADFEKVREEAMADDA